jgi:YfiH family protein
MFDISDMIPPTPASLFRWHQTAAGVALVCEPLEPFARHFFTPRTWKLGSRYDEAADEAAWSQVAAAIDAPLGMARLRQVHGRGVVMASPESSTIAEGDILITEAARLGIAVQAADCVPLLFVDARRGAIAAAHAGWRGMVADVPGATVAALQREFGCRPEDLLVAAGPSIGACCYEVGGDVRDGFIAAGSSADDIDAWFRSAPVPTLANPSMPMSGARPGRWFFDGWACVRAQLERSGIPAERIHAAGLCTASHPDAFPSYRRDGLRAGRIAGVIRVD